MCVYIYIYINSRWELALKAPCLPTPDNTCCSFLSCVDFWPHCVSVTVLDFTERWHNSGRCFSGFREVSAMKSICWLFCCPGPKCKTFILAGCDFAIKCEINAALYSCRTILNAVLCTLGEKWIGSVLAPKQLHCPQYLLIVELTCIV